MEGIDGSVTARMVKSGGVSHGRPTISVATADALTDTATVRLKVCIWGCLAFQDMALKGLHRSAECDMFICYE